MASATAAKESSPLLPPENGGDDAPPPPPPPPLEEETLTKNFSPRSKLKSAIKRVGSQTALNRHSGTTDPTRVMGLLQTLRSAVVAPFALDDEKEGDALRRVKYDTNSHLSVLFQMHGSVWPMVLPYCLVNVLLAYGISVCLFVYQWDMTFASTGHTFMAIMVAFLIVSRAQITYARFMEARGYLSTCYRCCRELIHHATVLTMMDGCGDAKEWRQEVAYKTILLLRVTMAAIEYQSTQVSSWDVADMPSSARKDMRMTLMLDDLPSLDQSNDPSNLSSSITGGGQQQHRIQKWAHGTRTLSDENFRAPIVLAYNLRCAIMRQRDKDVCHMRNMHVNEELKLLGFVSEYVTAFHGLKKLITTPFPFPLVQMARTFLFFWVFTLPFCLVKDIAEPVQVMIIVFFTTYGFIGLEYVSMELDDPFGDDPNDFDDLGMAQMCFEDIYIAIYKTDGKRSAEELRSMVSARVEKGGALENYRRDISREINSSLDNITERPGA